MSHDDQPVSPPALPSWLLIDPEDSCQDVACTRMNGRCVGVHCARCGKRGSGNQGHWWSYCAVTRSLRQFHFCCPGQCELEAHDQQLVEERDDASEPDDGMFRCTCMNAGVHADWCSVNTDRDTPGEQP